ncbi:MAG: phenylalanine--tRNA ligase subunit alpha, partial [Selenomonadaceae bacterium]|nr:phenylalanine--tRNA ligase subunit alpha [Selenomonadaceae bacterium]
MEQQIRELRSRADEAVNGATNLRELDDVRVKFLGKKGELTTLLRGMSKLSAEERPIVGKLV